MIRRFRFMLTKLLLYRGPRRCRRVRLVLVSSDLIALRSMLILSSFVGRVGRAFIRLLALVKLRFGELFACGSWLEWSW